MSKICLIGDILIDVTLKTEFNPLKMRLGGIVHAARALWAMGVQYDVAFFSPSYLDVHIRKYLPKMGCYQIFKLGDVKNLPYTILIGEAKEIGDQQYDFLLGDNNADIDYDENSLIRLSEYSQILVISGNYDLSLLIPYISDSCKIYSDVANNVKSYEDLKLKRKFDTLFLSTSSDLFKQYYSSFDDFIGHLSAYANRIVLKENRGGSRAFDCLKQKKYNIPSQTKSIAHSVGVGDVYDAVVMSLSDEPFEDALYRSSWIASDYALTTFTENFKQNVLRTLSISIADLKLLGGCLVPWEERIDCNIYIAAPDFDFVDRGPIDILCNSLEYHNFKPRRPIVENGQMSNGAKKEERIQLFSKDMSLLDECNILIAVIIYDDPGTYIEIGLAAQRRLPVIVYDPYQRANNCMLTELPTLVSHDLDVVISEVFNQYSKQLDYGN